MMLRILHLITFLTVEIQVSRATLTNYASGGTAGSFSPTTTADFAIDDDHSTYFESGRTQNNDYWSIYMLGIYSIATIWIDGPSDQWVDIQIGDYTDPFNACQEDVVLMGVHECIGTGNLIHIWQRSSGKFLKIKEIRIFTLHDVSKYATITINSGNTLTQGRLDNLFGA